MDQLSFFQGLNQRCYYNTMTRDNWPTVAVFRELNGLINHIKFNMIFLSPTKQYLIYHLALLAMSICPFVLYIHTKFSQSVPSKKLNNIFFPCLCLLGSWIWLSWKAATQGN